MCFFLFWLISLPAIWFPIHQMSAALFLISSFVQLYGKEDGLIGFFLNSRHLFTLKSIVTPIAGITFCIWCIVKAKGVGPIISRPPTVHGSELAWSMIVSLMSCINNMVTLLT
jgi:NCS1 family nucleobase:cation symporter-1